MSQQVINRLQTNRLNSINRLENINKELEPIIKDLNSNYNIYLNYGIKRDELLEAINYYNKQINDLRNSKVLLKIKIDNEPKNASTQINKERDILANELERIKEKEEEFNDRWVKIVDNAINDKYKLKIDESNLVDELSDIVLSVSNILDDKKNVRRQNRCILIDNIRVKKEYNDNIDKLNKKICELTDMIDSNTPILDNVTGEMKNVDGNPKIRAQAKKQLQSIKNQLDIEKSKYMLILANNNNNFKSDKFNECNMKYSELLALKSVKEAELAQIRANMTDCDNIISGNTDDLREQYAEFAKQNLAANNRMSIMLSRIINERNENINKYNEEMMSCENKICEYVGQIDATQGEISELDTKYKSIGEQVRRRTQLEDEREKLQKYIQDLTAQLNIYGISLAN